MNDAHICLVFLFFISDLLILMTSPSTIEWHVGRVSGIFSEDCDRFCVDLSATLVDVNDVVHKHFDFDVIPKSGPRKVIIEKERVKKERKKEAFAYLAHMNSKYNLSVNDWRYTNATHKIVEMKALEENDHPGAESIIFTFSAADLDRVQMHDWFIKEEGKMIVSANGTSQANFELAHYLCGQSFDVKVGLISTEGFNYTRPNLEVKEPEDEEEGGGDEDDHIKKRRGAYRVGKANKAGEKGICDNKSQNRWIVIRTDGTRKIFTYKKGNEMDRERAKIEATSFAY